MTKKNMRAAVEEGTSVLDQIVSGNSDAKKAKNTRNSKNTQDVKNGRPVKYEDDMIRLNLKIPVSIKEYLTVAAAKESIKKKRTVSLTEYFCDLVKTDMAKNK